MSLLARPSLGVLFVCSANICRSPMAEGILREELKLIGAQRKVLVDSAGTNATQIGHPADGRAQRVCAREGIDLRKSRSRQVVEQDLRQFDYILAMDQANYQWLCQAGSTQSRERVSLLGHWAPGGALGDIPDPYYGSVAGFEEVLALLHRGIDAFVPHLTGQLAEI